MRHPQSIKNLGENPVVPETLYGAAKTFSQGLVRKVVGDSVPLKGSPGGYQPLPPPSAPVTPKGPPPTNIPPTPSSSMLEAQKRAGDLTLADDLVGGVSFPPAPDRLTADVPPAPRGGLPFKASQPLAATLVDDLGIAPAPTGGIPGGQNPRAAGMSQDVPGTKLFPELRAVRGRPDEVVGENLAIHEGPDVGPPAPQGGSPPPGPQGNPGFDLAADLGIEVVPSAKRPGRFELRVPGEKSATAYPDEASARQAALDVADALLSDLPERPAQTRVAKPVASGQGMGPQNLFDELFNDSNLENNASGESAASVEAINRVASEKAAGRDRFMLNEDGSVVPLVGVDSVDAVAKPGQVIVQRGIGDKPYSVLDRGGLSKRAAENRITMVIDQLTGKE